MLAAPLHDLGLADSALQIAFIAQQHYDSFISLGATYIVPLFFDVFEGPLAGEVEHHQYSVATFEVGRYDGSVLFLAGGVPDVQFSGFVLESYVFHFEVDGGNLRIFLRQEISLGESPEKGSFSYIAISDDNYFILLLVFVHRQVPVFYHCYCYINQQRIKCTKSSGFSCSKEIKPKEGWCKIKNEEMLGFRGQYHCECEFKKYIN